MGTSSSKGNSDWGRLGARSATLRRGVQELANELRRLSGSDDRDAIRGAAIMAPEMERWRHALEELAPMVQDIVARLRREREDQAAGLDQRLQREIAQRGHSVTGEGGLLVVDGFVHVEIDVGKGSVEVNGRACEGTSAASVADAVDAEAERLRKLVTPPDKMVEQLLTAYKRELAGRGKEAGAQVEAAALLGQVVLLRQSAAFRSNPSSANFREYPRELFRADLHWLLSAGSPEADGQRLRYASGSDTAGSIFMHVPALGRCAHIGRMWFEPSGA